jgi:hypothetical protein
LKRDVPLPARLPCPRGVGAERSAVHTTAGGLDLSPDDKTTAASNFSPTTVRCLIRKWLSRRVSFFYRTSHPFRLTGSRYRLPRPHRSTAVNSSSGCYTTPLLICARPRAYPAGHYAPSEKHVDPTKQNVSLATHRWHPATILIAVMGACVNGAMSRGARGC